jgi:hypothetical protein
LQARLRRFNFVKSRDIMPNGCNHVF